LAKNDSIPVDRRRLGATGAEVSILGLGLGGAFMDCYEQNLEAVHALLESALAVLTIFPATDGERLA
jgi:hypothetical protein